MGERGRQHKTNLARLDHRVADLKRYGIQTVIIDSYGEITELLQALHSRVRMRNVPVSGAADEAGAFGVDRLNNFTEGLGRRLIEKGYNIVSGMGKGVGAQLLSGAHQALGRRDSGSLATRLRLFPFPYWYSDPTQRETRARENRLEMARLAGASIYIAGNKKSDSGSIIESAGVIEEFERAHASGQLIIPIGATGFVAGNVWATVMKDLPKYYGDKDVSAEFAVLGDKNASTDALIDTVMTILAKMS